MDREKFLASIYLIIKDDSGRILFQRRRVLSYGLVF